MDVKNWSKLFDDNSVNIKDKKLLKIFPFKAR